MDEKPKEKIVTYYLPRENPEVSVVLVTDGSNVARGVAILNSKDMFNRKLGRAIAMGRASKAFLAKRTCGNNEINREIAKEKTSIYFVNKCSFMPVLTPYEIKLLSSNG